MLYAQWYLFVTMIIGTGGGMVYRWLKEKESERHVKVTSFAIVRLIEVGVLYAAGAFSMIFGGS